MNQPTTDLAELRENVVRQFNRRFQVPPSHVAIAPGRVNLIGGHVDYNDGFVLPLAIPRYVVVAGRAKPSDRASESSVADIVSLDFDEQVSIPITRRTVASLEGWTAYVEGVQSGFLEREINVPGYQAVIGSNLPIGGGLSSSAALEVAFATLLESLTGASLDRLEKAKMCQHAEHAFAKVPCGIMDQFSSVFGKADHLMLLDCQNLNVQQIPFASPDTGVLIINSRVRHQLTSGDYEARRRGCETALEKLNRRSWRDVMLGDIEQNQSKLNTAELAAARHIVGEIKRTLVAASAIESGDWVTAGQQMNASHGSIRDDFRASCSEIDLLFELTQQLGAAQGVWGARMTGGGFGGCLVCLVKIEKADRIAELIQSRYQSETGIRPTWFTCRPVSGAYGE